MIKQAAIISLVLGLGACASQVGYHAGDMQAANDTLGKAVRQNIAAQTVNPAGSSAPVVHDGARTAKAVAAYQQDKVEKPASAGTSQMSSSGSSAGTGGNK